MKAFTLVELLVVLSIISVLLALILPSLGKVRRHVRSKLSMVNQRTIVQGVTEYAVDHKGRYPMSVARIGTDKDWVWWEPTYLTGYIQRSPGSSTIHRSLSGYLKSYIDDASVMFCPSAPREYPYLHESWEAGDSWRHPDLTVGEEDMVVGVYSFYWNYVGYREGTPRPFVGPRREAGGRGQSRLMVSDYFGYGHWRNKNRYNNRLAYGSCEKMNRARITPGSLRSSDFWSRQDGPRSLALEGLGITLHAGYTDGHVESYTPQETVIMKVSLAKDGSIPWPDDEFSPGDFYLPQDAVH